ncbi:MAG: 50S ribosomal protein L32 [Elusimicrobiaceae bacterium]
MPNPKRRHTRARRDSRRAQNWKLEVASISKCPNCGEMRRPHQVCAKCGYYKDKVVVAIKAKKDEAGKAES